MAKDLFCIEEVLRTAVTCVPFLITESVIVAIIVCASGLIFVEELVGVQPVRESHLESVFKFLNALFVY